MKRSVRSSALRTRGRRQSRWPRIPKPKTRVSSGEIVREHSGHVAVCCSVIGAPRARGGRTDLPPGGTTPVRVTPDAPVVGEQEGSTRVQDALRGVYLAGLLQRLP